MDIDNQDQILEAVNRRMEQLRGDQTLTMSYNDLMDDNLGDRLDFWLVHNTELPGISIASDTEVTIAMDDQDAVAYQFGPFVILWLDDGIYVSMTPSTDFNQEAVH